IGRPVADRPGYGKGLVHGFRPEMRDDPTNNRNWLPPLTRPILVDWQGLGRADGSGRDASRRSGCRASALVTASASAALLQVRPLSRRRCSARRAAGLSSSRRPPAKCRGGSHSGVVGLKDWRTPGDRKNLLLLLSR